MPSEAPPESRTEEATPHKLRKAKERGEVPRSKEVTSAGVLMAATLLLVFVFPLAGSEFVELYTGLMVYIERGADVESVRAMIGEGERAAHRILGPFLGALALITFVVGWTQGQFTINEEAFSWKAERLDPVKNVKQKFGIRALVNFSKQILRLALIGGTAFLVIYFQWPIVLGVTGGSAADVASAAGRLVLTLLAATSLLYFLLAMADYAFERYKFLRDQRMTREEVKDEIRQTVGDPEVRRRLRERMERQMLEEIARADVAIINPIHRAVVLRYRPAEDIAPVVVAMGVRTMALRIRALAEKHGVPIVTDPALAKALLRTATVGQPIPEPLWNAVTVVMRKIYALRYGSDDPGDWDLGGGGT